MAPEFFERKYIEKAENLAYGVVMYKMYCGAPSFIDKTPSEIKIKIKICNVIFGNNLLYLLSLIYNF